MTYFFPIVGVSFLHDGEALELGLFGTTVTMRALFVIDVKLSQVCMSNYRPTLHVRVHTMIRLGS